MSKYKKIIVIGVDGSGKTTLINKLSEVVGYQVVKGSSFELTGGKNQDELFETFNELCDLENVIFDRFAHCNHVYAPLFDDYARVDEIQIRKLENKIKEETLLIFLTASTSTIKERFETRGEDYVSIEQVDLIKKSYSELLSQSVLTTLSFNTTYIGTEAIVESILPFTK